MKIQTSLIIAVLAFIGWSSVANAQIINTIAGNGAASYSGDSAAATLATLKNPYGVAVDAAGNVYIADYNNHRVRKVNSAGVISTFAGTGVAGSSGDGAAATLAQLNYPVGVAVDAAGNVYIVDRNNHRIRKINSGGVISTIAGTGIQGYSGDGTAATLATLNDPFGVAVDAGGNVYISDMHNHRIRKVNTSGIISTFAGTGALSYSGDGAAATLATLNTPYGVATDNSGNVYIADGGNHRIRKINTNGIISTIAGTGAAGYSGDGAVATLATLNNPEGVAVDVAGNVYFADTYNSRIRKVNSGGIISTFAGTGMAGYSGDGGAATLARLLYSTGVAMDPLGNLYIADNSNQRIRKVTCNSPTLTVNSGSVCSGQIFTMVASGAFTYTFSSGSAMVSPTANASYSVMGTSSGGCVSTTPAISNVSVNPSPIVTAVSSSSLLCPQQTVTLSGSGATTYTWSTGATTTVIAVSPTTTTSYTVSGTNSVGCSASYVITQSVSTCAGIETHGDNGVAMNVFPNPGTGLYTVDVESATKIEVYDVFGRTVLSTSIEASKFNLNISEQAKGLYILKASCKGKTESVRLVKE